MGEVIRHGHLLPNISNHGKKEEEEDGEEEGEEEGEKNPEVKSSSCFQNTLERQANSWQGLWY